MDDEVRQPREWDAGSYHGLAQPHEQWATQILDRLPLQGDEVVLDLGCGTGRLTVQLLSRLGPEASVIGIDGSQAMVDDATARLGADPRASFERQDLLSLSVPSPADAAVSSATFHWIKDHDLLFHRIRAALRPGAPFVAQCGGSGNVSNVVRAVTEVSSRDPYAPYFTAWPGPWNYATPEATTSRLTSAGFHPERVWLEPSPQYPTPLRDFLRTVSLGSHLERLPPELHDAFINDVAEAMQPDPVHHYDRLNIIARAI
jgi:trans-aconitate 2-methyltransferase